MAYRVAPRARALGLGCVLTAAALVATATAATAQGFLDFLFGSGGAKPQSAPAQSPLLTPGGRPYLPSGPFATPMPRRDGDDDDFAGRGGSFRTVCVRMCDGYYFPISAATGRKGFLRDQMRCTSSCGGDARLFYHASASTDMDAAVDLSGRAYGRLPVAFKYRKTLVEGCQCRQAPWSEAEASRHRVYAEVEERNKPAEARATQMAEATAASKGEALSQKRAAAEPGAAAPPLLAAAVVADAGGADAARIATPAPVKSTKPASQTMRQAAQSNRGPYAVKMAAQPSPASGNQQSTFGGGMGLGGGKLVWPGDSPPPRR